MRYFPFLPSAELTLGRRLVFCAWRLRDRAINGVTRSDRKRVGGKEDGVKTKRRTRYLMFQVGRLALPPTQQTRGRAPPATPDVDFGLQPSRAEEERPHWKAIVLLLRNAKMTLGHGVIFPPIWAVEHATIICPTSRPVLALMLWRDSVR